MKKIGKREPRSIEELSMPTSNLWEFTKEERIILLDHWAKAMRQEWVDHLVIKAQEHKEKVEELNVLSSEYSREVLDGADIIGLTTTGLAKYAPILSRIDSKTLICEEAGEVLEVSSYTVPPDTFSPIF